MRKEGKKFFYSFHRNVFFQIDSFPLLLLAEGKASISHKTANSIELIGKSAMVSWFQECF